jgi:RNA polymerase sigma-70 factor (ECF subfamily)
MEKMMDSSKGLLSLSPQLGAPERSFVFAVAMKIVKNEIEAEDVAQDALLLAHRHRQSFRGQSKYSTWLYRVAVTTALMHLRTKRRKRREISTSQLGENEQHWLEALECKGPSPEQICASRQELANVERSLERLGSKYARLLRMRWYEGCSDRELSSRLDLPLTTVKNRTFRARRHVLSEYCQAA